MKFQRTTWCIAIAVAVGVAMLLLGACGSDNPVNSEPGWRWSALGGGLPSEVTAVVQYNGELYAGGRFANKDYVRVYRGGSWVLFGDTMYSSATYPVYGLAVYGGRLIVAGDFDSVGHVTTHNIAAWDGASWSALGAGLPSDMIGGRMIEYDGQLFVSSRYNTFMSPDANIMVWNGSDWTTILTRPSGMIRDMCLYGGELAVAGDSIVDLGGGILTYPWVWCWTGTAWHAITGSGGDCPALAVMNDTLFKVRNYDCSFWAWTGSAWSERSTNSFEDDGHVASAYGLDTFGGKLVISGDFDRIDGAAVGNIAQWDGSAFTPLAGGVTGGSDPRVRCVIAVGDRLIVGGQFTQAGGRPASNIAEWSYK